MDITINGKTETINTELTITELLKAQKVEMPDMVSVELNGEFLDRDKFETTSVKTGDQIEFLYFMGGGAQL